MTKVVVRNLGKKEISQFCLLMKVNKKTYELCYGKTKKLLIERNGKKTFLINLSEFMNISIDEQKPLVKIVSNIK